MRKSQPCKEARKGKEKITKAEAIQWEFSNWSNIEANVSKVEKGSIRDWREEQRPHTCALCRKGE